MEPDVVRSGVLDQVLIWMLKRPESQWTKFHREASANLLSYLSFPMKIVALGVTDVEEKKMTMAGGVVQRDRDGLCGRVTLTNTTRLQPRGHYPRTVLSGHLSSTHPYWNAR